MCSCVCACVCFPARVGICENHFVLTELSFFLGWGNNGSGSLVRSVAPCGDAGCCLGESICKCVVYVYVYIHIYIYMYICICGRYTVLRRVVMLAAA